MVVHFVVPGDPQGKGRPRHTLAGRTYTPEKTRAYEELVRACARTRVTGQPSAKTLWRVLVTAFTARPKTRPQGVSPEAWRSGERLQRRGKPDVDNVLKAILDALNGIVWADDAQVVEVVVRRWTCAAGDEPGVLVMAEALP